MEYLYVVMVCLIYSIFLKKNNTYVILSFIIIISIFAANRSVIIQDTQAYIDIYKNLSFNVSKELNATYMEPGFIFLSILNKYIFGNNYKTFFFNVTMLNFMLLVKTILNLKQNNIYISKNKIIDVLMVYILTYGFVFNYITLRAGLAFSFSLLAFSYLYINKLKFLLLLITAFLFQNSVIIYVVIFPLFIYNFMLNKSIIIIWFFILLIFLYIGYNNYVVDLFFLVAKQIPFLASRYKEYLDKNLLLINNSRAVLRILILIVLGLTFNKKYLKNKFYNFIYSMYLVGLSISVLFFNIAIVGRLVEMFMAIVPLIIVINYNKIKKDFISLLVFCVFILYFVISNYRLVLYAMNNVS